MRKNIGRAGICLGILGLSINVFAVQDNDLKTVSPRADFKQRWIHGSLVNVRAEPIPDGAVLAQLKVNTPVQANSNSTPDSFCEIVWGESQHGFVSCQLLGDKVLTLEEVASAYLPDGRTPNPNYSATRAFWIEPGVERLLEAGRYFETKFLTAEELARENQFEGSVAPKLRRFSIPEFEAMKSVMRNGVIGVAPSNNLGRLPLFSRKLASWTEIKAIAKAGNPSDHFSMYNELKSLELQWGLRDPSVELLQEMELPSVKTSLFKNEKEIARPRAEAEEISAKFSIPYRAVVKSGRQWVPSGHTEPGYYFGYWDVGTVESSLTKEVFKYTVYASGNVVEERTLVKGGRHLPKDANGEECSLGYELGDASAKVWKGLIDSSPWVGAPKGKKDPVLFYFYSKDSMGITHAKVTKQTHNFFVDGFVSATSRYFDVDSDGVNDLLMWEGTGKSKQSIHDPGDDLPHYRMMFINISSEWYLLAVDEFLYGCGC